VLLRRSSRFCTGIQTMTKLRATALRCVLILSASSAMAAGGLENENLLVAPPPGYKVGFDTKKPNMVMTEFVPDNETVDDWTEMVTVQVFFGLKTTPHQFMENTDKLWRGGCPAATEAHTVADAAENGYPTLVWLLDCPKNPKSGKPEITWFKAVQGNDSFYLVQKAFKFMPDKDQINRWMGYLKKVSVCDSRLAERACPKTAD
jgi:hypothetical protein